MNRALEIAILIVIALAAIELLVRALLRRMEPQKARLIVPWTTGLSWALWVLSGVLMISGHTRYFGLVMIIYSSASLVSTWVKRRTELQDFPARFRISPPLLAIAGNTYIGVKDPASSAAWYVEKLELLKLAPSPGFSTPTIALRFSEDDDNEVWLGPQDNASSGRSPVFFTRRLVKARNKLSSRAIEVGPIQTDRQGTHYFEFRDLEGNTIEVCGRE